MDSNIPASEQQHLSYEDECREQVEQEELRQAQIEVREDNAVRRRRLAKLTADAMKQGEVGTNAIGNPGPRREG